MSELKNCPFCGAEPSIGKWAEHIDQSDTCPTAIECSSDLGDCPVQPSVCKFSRDEAIEAWNARTSPLAALTDEDWVELYNVMENARLDWATLDTPADIAAAGRAWVEGRKG